MAFASTTIVAPSTSQGPYVIPFPFILTSHVFATVNGNPATVDFINGQNLFFDTPVVQAGDTIVLYRETFRTTPLVDFEEGGPILADDLDRGFLQMLYIAQEILDGGSPGASFLPLGGSGHWDAQGLRLTNLADATAAQDAVTKAQLDAAVVGAGNLPDPALEPDNAMLAVDTGAWVVKTAAQIRTGLGLGTAALKDFGVAANQLVELDATGKLPAVDGSQLTNLPATSPAAVPQMIVNFVAMALLQDATAGAWYQAGAGVTYRLQLDTETSVNNGGGEIGFDSAAHRIQLLPGTYLIEWNQGWVCGATAIVEQEISWAIARSNGGSTAVIENPIPMFIPINPHTVTGTARVYITVAAATLFSFYGRRVTVGVPSVLHAAGVRPTALITKVA